MAELPLHSFLAERGQMVEAALHRCVAGLAGIVPDELHAALGNGVIGSGKRLRPLLLVTACEELGGDIGETLYDLSVSVEAIHAYSLLHDDLPCMDDAALRRGRPTVHVAHGVRAATVAGGVLIPWAAAWAFESALRSGCGEDAARRIVLLLLEAAGAGGMIGGQAMDLLAEGRSLAEEELERLHGMKTGALLAASLEIGAVAAGAGDDEYRAMGAFGRRVGLAFQVMDDVLDATGSAESLGKRPSDAEHGKSTYVLLLGVEGARKRGRELIAQALSILDQAGLAAPRLRQLARFVVERRR
ncbi:MAG: polyprenyl synthetase family protein [Gemmatimonadetes bacterium]|nr:polyprenyl synthetase family protein [Gemmatimonadota bacterium]MYI06516.1 polyprenyl synthetase family protein [Gemmatimonadota bacterium]